MKTIIYEFPTRRTILLWMIVLVVIALPGGTPVNAQGTTILSIEPSSVSIIQGSSTTLTVFITNGSNINAYDVTVLYDASILTLTSWSHGSYLTNLATIVNENTPGRLHLVSTQLATPVASGDGTLLSLVFRATLTGSSAITLENPQFAGANGELIIPLAINGVVTVDNVAIPSSTSTSSPTPTTTSTVTSTLTATRTQTKTATVTPSVTLTNTISILKTLTRTPVALLTAVPVRSNTPAGGSHSENTPKSTQTAVISDPATLLSLTHTEDITPSPTILFPKAAEQHPNLKTINLLLWVFFFILITILLCTFLLFFFRKKGE